ncbi:hypothetical protein ACIOKD_38000 [Streptomyces sp. NPDC087844]|uniref:hypothetical protein n=1 Tax=Streptomyces sp. NPDC087844 TaxID=3365805 RepID=UPI003815CF47
MPTSYDPSFPSLSPQKFMVQEVQTRFDTHARIRGTRGSRLPASRVGPRDEERAFGDLQQAFTRLRAFSREQDKGKYT